MAGEYFFMPNDLGILNCLDWSAIVVQAGKEFKVLARNKLGEDLATSRALAEGKIFLRGANHMWCLGD